MLPRAELEGKKDRIGKPEETLNKTDGPCFPKPLKKFSIFRQVRHQPIG